MVLILLARHTSLISSGVALVVMSKSPGGSFKSKSRTAPPTM